MSWRSYIQHGRRHGPAGSDPIPGMFRLCFGQVDGSSGTGTIHDPGSGDWTVTGDGSGLYTVTFDTPFASNPTVVLAENDTTTNPPAWVSLTAVSTGSFEVTTSDHSADAESDDIGFNFIAVGI